jgi:hypothetical protein
VIHPDTELSTFDPAVGVGVRTTAPIPRGTLLWVRDRFDFVLDPADVERLPPLLWAQLDRLGYRDARGQFVLCWDGGKHVNHSCAPAMRGVGHDAMIAVRDLGPGDEVTCDYAECNLDQPLDCLCGAPGCRRTIVRPTPPACWAAWQPEVEAAVELGRSLPQPLLEVAVDEDLPKVLAGTLPVPKLRLVENAHHLG